MIDRFVKQQARDTITQNAYKDKANVRYARVPQKTDTYDAGCPFCQMLASRGFVYYSEKTAGGTSRLKEFGAYHDKCNCQPVPAFSTRKADGYGRRNANDVQIDGYDPDELFKYYLDHLRRFTSYRSKSSREGVTGWTGGAKKKKWWTHSGIADDYQGIFDDVMEYVRGAKTYDELRQRCAEMDAKYKKRGWSVSELYKLQNEIATLKQELRSA